MRELAAAAVSFGCTGMWTGTEGANAGALATYRSLGATVDAESVLIAWDKVAWVLASDAGQLNPQDRPHGPETIGGR